VSQFQPSQFSNPSYGYENDPYAAQTMFTTWHQGRDVGDLGTVSPDVASSIIGLVGTAATVGVSVGSQAVQAKKAREHELKMAKKQEKLYAEQAKLMAEEAKIAQVGGEKFKTTMFYVFGTVAFVGALGAGVWFIRRRG
jgi:hypothetical protein